ncbi:MAG: hypothetical protein MI748_17595 [Opitutales bacterium]|nr:hypothetical protein [Opitutales bacterium]
MATSPQQLILRSNRHLTTLLLENQLVSNEIIEQANSRLLQNLQSGKSKYASILSILIYELNAMEQSRWINLLVDKYKMGLIALDNIDLSKAPTEGIDIEMCWASMTVPFSTIGKATCLATCYFVSKPIQEYWEEQFEKILWYTTSVQSMSDALDSFAQPETENNDEKPAS